MRPQLPQNINGTYQLGRETYLSPVTWSEDGWPLANNGSAITFEMDDASLPSQEICETSWSDDFSSPDLGTGWEFRGTPYGNWYHISNSSLTLRGTPRTLSALDGIALILIRQDALVYNFSVDLEFQPTLESHEAGIVAWVNEEYHHSVSLTLCKNQTSIVCLKTMTIAQGGDIDGNVTTTYTPLPEEYVSGGVVTIRLHIRATPDTYQLGYSGEDSKSPIWPTAFSASWMAPRSGGRIAWNGARVGMFASGNGVLMLKDATFRRVEVSRDKCI